MKKSFYLLLLLIPFIMPKNVFAKVNYADSTPISINVWTSDSGMSPTTQSVLQRTFFNRVYYGFGYGSYAQNFGLTFNYAENSQINDKDLVSINFGFYGAGLSGTYNNPFSQVFLKDSYENSITCYVDPTTRSNGANIADFSTGVSYACNRGHISGPFTLTFSGQFYHQASFVGVSEISFSFEDGTSSDSTTIGGIKSDTNTIKQNSESTKNNTNDIKNNTKETNDLIKNTDTTESKNSASAFFSDFSRNSHGLTGIVTAPLRLIESFTTASCSPITFQLPFVNNWVTLPCMRSIYETHFGVFFTLYQLITTGVICYGVCINLYSKLRQLENPNNDRIEVLQL